MNRKLRLAAISLALMTFLAVGCDPASLSYFLFKGDGKAPAEFPLKAPEGRKDVRIAILMSAPNAPVEFAGIERDLSRQLGQILVDQTKDKREPFRVIEAAKIEKFKMQTPGWKSLTSAEIGRQLGADVVIDARITNLGLYEAGLSKYMYQGQGTVDAEVFDTATGKAICPQYFINVRLDSKPSDTMQANQYRALLVQRIADEMSWKHLPHETDRRVAPSP